MTDVIKLCARCHVNPRNGSSPSYCRDCQRAIAKAESARRQRVPQVNCSRCGNLRTGAHMSYCVPCLAAWKAEKAKTCTRCGAVREPGEGTQFAYCVRCQRDGWMRRKYGISIDVFDAMLAAQGGLCEICGESDNGRQWHVDHCHGSGRVRGILCDNCNRGIGHLKDSAALLRAAADYLDR